MKASLLQMSWQQKPAVCSDITPEQITLHVKNYKLHLLVATGCLLLMSIYACDRSDAPGVEDNNDSIVTPSYDAGYELGIKLALLREQLTDNWLKEAVRGLCDALNESGTEFSEADICSSQNMVSSNATGKLKPQATVSSSGIRAEDDFATLNARRDGVVVLPSTVQYEVLKLGSGSKPVEGDVVLVSYQASLPDGKIFDTTYEEGEPLHMALDDIAIPGLKEALLLMPEGSQWRVVIPPKMGFGRSGNNRLRRRDVIYEIELVDIESPE
jgi:FKBP-type peptidyl-prolyl cis-trans isomerase FklB